MKRRDFLKRIGVGGAGAAAVVALPVAVSAAEKMSAPASVGEMVQDGDKVYRYQKMCRSVRKGELIFADDDLAGMAVRRAKTGEYCWIQIAGPMSVDVKQ
jgi:hypothetical protein